MSTLIIFLILAASVASKKIPNHCLEPTGDQSVALDVVEECQDKFQDIEIRTECIEKCIYYELGALDEENYFIPEEVAHILFRDENDEAKDFFTKTLKHCNEEHKANSHSEETEDECFMHYENSIMECFFGAMEEECGKYYEDEDWDE